MARTQTIGTLVNRVAVGVGLESVTDPFSSDDPSFVQLRTLANECGEDLLMVEGVQWQRMERTKSFTTADGDTGIYDLPDDFGYMIDQTGWQVGGPGAAYPLLGPASAQWWSYLEAASVYNLSIYAWFRHSEGQLQLMPQPPPAGIPIKYKYISRYWVIDGATTPTLYKDSVSQTSDIVLFEPILFIKKLKLAFLTAKGFDTTKAQDEYDVALSSVGARDKPAPVLSLNGPVGYTPPLLNSLINVPETGWGE